MTSAKVVDGQAFVTLDGFECTHMTISKVYHMDIVSYTSTVMGIVVVAEHAKFLADADGGLSNIGHQVVGDSVRILADETALVDSDWIEVAKQHHVPLWISLLNIHQYLLKHRLGPSVWIRALALRTLLGDWDDGGITIHSGGGREDDVLAAILTHHVH